MFKRALCILLVLLLCVSSAFAEKPAAERYDFHLTFRMDGDVFPPSYRLRARGYASLINRLSLDGDLTFCTEYDSIDLNASLYFTDKPEVAIRFRLYGIPGRLFFTSPLIGSETVLLNMAAFLEFTVKAQKTLGIDMPWLAFCYPYCNERSLGGLLEVWNANIGTVSGKEKISQKKMKSLTDSLEELLQNDIDLLRWIGALADLSSSPSLVETEFFSLPDYLYYHVAGGKALTVRKDKSSETWKNASGETLFSRTEEEGSSSALLTLPSTENGYSPFFSLETSQNESVRSFRLTASMRKDGADDAASEPAQAETEASAASTESEEEGWWDEDVQASVPDHALTVFAAGENLPLDLPEDAEFSLDFSLTGALFPNFALKLLGSAKKDGSIAVSVCKPFEEASEPVVILCCEGTITAAAPEYVPDYRNQPVEGCHNAFSFNELSLAEFRGKVTSPLVRGLLSFVAEAPAAACQSLLDDLTDLNILDFILEQ